MSPASSGSLEVEKYIGACLISQSRPKSLVNNSRRDVFYSRLPEIYPGNYVNFDNRFRLRQHSADRWAGGMPLISFANHQRRNRQQTTEISRSASPKVIGEETHNPLARLAVHTQGAPLILTKTCFNGRRSKNYKNPPSSRSCDNDHKPNKCVENANGGGGGGVDTVSVTSDESSGSGNSDNCLPRIIKPRKRRKKERKPSILHQDGFSTDSASPDIDTVLRPYTPFVFDPHLYGVVPDRLPSSSSSSSTTLRISEPISETENEVSETPQLHHTFEDVEEVEDVVDVNGNQSTTLCQCRYCDPAGQIWDVERNCYSPFLTAPIRGGGGGLFQFTNFQVDDGSTTMESLEEDGNCLVRGMSSISLEDRGGKAGPKVVVAPPSRDLEVSTEIVTSLNGHRDIEIRFFSPSSAEIGRTLSRSIDNNGIGPPRESSDDFADISVNNEYRFTLPDE